MCGGALAGVLLGGAAFIITDLIASAITGAIERSELNEAIDSLRNLLRQIDPCLPEATVKLAGITQSIKQESYELDDTHILVRKPDGSYVIIDLSTVTNGSVLTNKPGKEILFLSA